MADKSMRFKIGADDSASAVFTTVAAAAEKLEKALDKLDKKHVKPKVTLDGADAAHTRVTELSQAMNALDNKRVKVEADLGTSRADVGELRQQLSYLKDKKLKVRVDVGTAVGDIADLGAMVQSFRDVKAKVDLDTGEALTRATALKARLDELRDVRIKVEVEAGDARTELTAIARAARRLNGLNGNDIRVRIHVVVDPPGIRVELEGIASALRRIRDTRATVTSNANVVGEDVRRLGAELGRLTKVSAISLSIPGLIATTGQVASLGASVVQLSGALGLVPAAGAAAAATVATLTVGLSGFGEAMKAREDAAAFTEALQDLSPAAAEVATQVRDLGPAWDGLRLDTQEALFRDLTDTVAQLSDSYLPVMKTGLVGIATELNTGAADFALWAAEGRTVADVNTILGNTRTTLRELAPAGVNVAAALTDVAAVGSGVMPELATGATAATQRFREFTAEARRTGELEQWIRGGVEQVAQLGRITLNTGGILGSVFSASEEAGYGFLDAVEQATFEVEQLLSSAEGRQALVELFRGSEQAISATLPGMRQLGAATLDTVGAFAANDGVTEFGTAVSNAATAAAPLVSVLGDLAGDTLQSLAGGANIASAALAPIVGLAAAVTTGLGPLPGVVIASVVAFRLLGAAGPLFATLATRIAATSAAAGLYATALTGSMAAGGAANTAVTRLGAAVGFLGRALPVVGVAAIAAGVGLDAFTTSTGEAVQIMSQGGSAADNLTGTLVGQTAALSVLEGALGGVFDANLLGVGTVESVTAAMAKQRAEMTALERAQADAATAQREYQQAVDQFGVSSPQATAAARDLASATDAVEAAQRAAERATMSHSDAMLEQVGAAQSALGANIDLETALRRVADSQKAANDAAREYGAGSQEAAAAMSQFVADADEAAQAAARVAEQQAEANAAGTGAAAGAAAYGASLLSMAATAEGPARAALLGHLANLDSAQLSALSAGAAATGFATQLLTLPDGRTVTIAVDPQTGKIVDTQTLLDGMRDADVAVNLEAQAALDQLSGFIGLVNGAAGTVSIDGNPQAAGTALQTVLAQIAAGAETVTINGQAVPARQALSMIVGQIGASNATVTINGQAVPAGQVLSQTLGAINRGSGTVTINGQKLPADRVLGALIGSVNSASGVISILGRDAGVATLKARLSQPSTSTTSIIGKDTGVGALKARLSSPSSSTHTVFFKTVGSVPKPNHDGDVVPAQRYKTGGVAPTQRYAQGGMRPFRAGTAQVFPPRMLRITGDRTDVDEFYIPDNTAPRSMALGAEWARRRGMELVPGAAAAAGRAAALSRAPQMRQVLNQQPRSAPTVVTAQVDMRPVAGELRGLVAALGGGDQRAVVDAVDRLAAVLTGPQRLSAESHRLAGTDGHW